MDNDMTARRGARLSPAGAKLLAEIEQAMEGAPDDHSSGCPASPSGYAGCPRDQVEITALLGTMMHGAPQAEAARLNAAAAAAEDAKQIILAAQEKLRAEGKPVDPAMTVAEAYEVLEGPQG